MFWTLFRKLRNTLLRSIQYLLPIYTHHGYHYGRSFFLTFFFVSGPTSHTVDGRNPANHLGFIKPCKEWDFNYISLNWLASSDFWSINSFSLRNLQQDPLNGLLNLSIYIVALATYLRGPLGFGPIQFLMESRGPKGTMANCHSTAMMPKLL